MAPKNKPKGAPSAPAAAPAAPQAPIAAAPAAPAVPTLSTEQNGVLLQIAQQTDAGTALMVSDEFNAPLLAAGLIQTDETTYPRDAEGRVATVITDAGRKYLAGANVGYTMPDADSEGEDGTEDEGEAEATFAFADVDVPVVQRRGGAGGSKAIYPFEKLGVKGTPGQPNSFFIPATDKAKEPWKSLASTVSAANRRFSETVVGPDGKPVMESYTVRAQKEKGTPGQPDYKAAVAASTGTREKTKALRKFVLRHIKDGAQWGEQFKGVEGAAVIRAE